MAAVPSAHVLVASGLGDDTGGGVFALGTNGFAAIDRVSTTGLAVSADGTRLARLPWTDDDPQTSGEVLLYDRRGVLAFHRVDALQESHGVAFDGDRLAVVSTLTNRVLWLDGAGRVARAWVATHADGDCWHLNNLAVCGGRLLVSAFGRFEHHRGWAAPGVRDGAGIVVDTTTGATVLGGLHAPHDPLAFDDGWLICNSGASELLVLNPAGAITARRALGGWTRGLAVDGDRIYVGVSAHRLQGAEGTAVVVALDRRTLRELARWPLPCREVFSLVLVEPALVEGLRTGFGANLLRMRERATFGTAPDTTPHNGADANASAACLAVAIAAPLDAVEAGSSVAVPFKARNDGPGVVRSTGGAPLLVGARWTAADTGEPAGEARARLAEPLLPGHAGAGVVRLAAPAHPGRYRLTLRTIREGLPWIDDGDPALADARLVEVIAPPR